MGFNTALIYFFCVIAFCFYLNRFFFSFSPFFFFNIFFFLIIFSMFYLLPYLFFLSFFLKFVCVFFGGGVHSPSSEISCSSSIFSTILFLCFILSSQISFFSKRSFNSSTLFENSFPLSFLSPFHFPTYFFVFHNRFLLYIHLH